MEKNKTAELVPMADFAQQLDAAILTVTGDQGISGFQKAFLLSDGIQKLKELLTPQYMSPIMAMQGNKLGFKTDKDKTGGYPMEVVKNCLIEAVLFGLEPYGNQFNIIAGNMYMTKEGAGHWLNNFKGLKYDLVCSLPRIGSEKTSAAVDVTINWTLKGESNTKVIPIPIKMDSYTSVDAIIGKATRKGRAWLINAITGIEVGDGDVEESSAQVVSTKINPAKKSEQEIEDERMLILISDASTIEELEFYAPSVSENILHTFQEKYNQILNAKK